MLFLASMAILKFRATVAICDFMFYQYETFVLKGLYIIPKHRVLGCSTCFLHQSGAIANYLTLHIKL